MPRAIRHNGVTEKAGGGHTKDSVTVYFTHRLQALALVSLLWSAGGACTDAPAVPSLQPGFIDFGDVVVGRRAERTVQLQNLGRGTLTIDSIDFGAPVDDAFSLVFDDTGATLQPGEETPLTVRFTPGEVGLRSGVVRVQTTGEEGDRAEVTLSLNGAGTSVTLGISASVLAFGDVVVGTERTLALEVTNQSDVDLAGQLMTGLGVRPCGEAGTSFCVERADERLGDDGRFTLAARGRLTLRIRFTPIRAGAEQGEFVLRACSDNACDTRVRVTGRGVNVGLRCSPSSLDFGAVRPSTCRTRTVSCTNIIGSALSVSSRLSEQTSTDFTIASVSGGLLAVGETIDIDMTYCPTSLAADEGALVVAGGVGDAFEVSLAGTGGGPDVDVTTETIDFGLATLVAPTRRTFLVTNVGFTSLQILEVVPDSRGTGAFTFHLPMGINLSNPLEPGETLEITVEFLPRAVGPVESAFIVRTNDPSRPEISIRLLGEGVDLPPCQFEWAPASVGFGVVQSGLASTQFFEIRNIGSDDCLVSSVRMEPGSDPEFVVSEPELRSVLIAPGMARTIGVGFTPPVAGRFTGHVEVSISASMPDSFLRVPVSGHGADELLTVMPSERDFGVRWVGCSTAQQAVQIYNLTGVPATIQRIRLVQSGSAFSLTSTPTTPVALASGDAVSFGATFRAVAASEYAAAVEVSATLGAQPQTYIVPLRGRGVIDGTQVDRFARRVPATDVLFVVQARASTRDYLENVAMGIDAFLQVAATEGVDYQIAVTTADFDMVEARFCPIEGPATDRIVRPRPGASATLASNVDCRGFWVGPTTDREYWGFESARFALSAPLNTGHNAGFLRRNARLSLIFISDYLEQSPYPPDFYRDYFRRLKGHGQGGRFVASAVSGARTLDCTGQWGTATQGPRYVDLVQSSGGVWQEFCNGDVRRTLQNLGAASFGRQTRFHLRNLPAAVSTLEVAVDGVVVPPMSPSGRVNWTYDVGSNSVTFAPFATPERDAEIDIEYVAQCQ